MFSPKYKIGDRVFAKMRGYPPWPAKIEGVLPGNYNIGQLKYEVFFYGTNQFGYCKEQDLHLYLENRKLLGKPKKVKGFNESVHEIDSELGLKNTNKSTNELGLDISADIITLPTPRETSELVSIGNVSCRPTSVHSGCSPSKNDLIFSNKQNCNSMPMIRNKCEKNANRLSALKVEAQLLDIDLGIQNSLTLNKADPQACLKYLNELFGLEINKLILKKHPEIIDLLIKLQNYVGNTSSWNMSETEMQSFVLRTREIQAKAKLVYDKIQSMFQVPYRKTFLGFFKEELEVFHSCTKNITRDEFYYLTSDPTEGLDTVQE